jgi:hypothetical protein
MKIFDCPYCGHPVSVPGDHSLVRWIPVAERKPMPGITVLVRYHGERWYNDKLNCWDEYEGGYSPNHHTVDGTEWMEVPE